MRTTLQADARTPCRVSLFRRNVTPNNINQRNHQVCKINRTVHSVLIIKRQWTNSKRVTHCSRHIVNRGVHSVVAGFCRRDMIWRWRSEDLRLNCDASANDFVDCACLHCPTLTQRTVWPVDSSRCMNIAGERSGHRIGRAVVSTMCGCIAN